MRIKTLVAVFICMSFVSCSEKFKHFSEYLKAEKSEIHQIKDELNEAKHKSYDLKIKLLELELKDKKNTKLYKKIQEDLNGQDAVVKGFQKKLNSLNASVQKIGSDVHAIKKDVASIKNETKKIKKLENKVSTIKKEIKTEKINKELRAKQFKSDLNQIDQEIPVADDSDKIIILPNIGG